MTFPDGDNLEFLGGQEACRLRPCRHGCGHEQYLHTISLARRHGQCILFGFAA